MARNIDPHILQALLEAPPHPGVPMLGQRNPTRTLAENWGIPVRQGLGPQVAGQFATNALTVQSEATSMGFSCKTARLDGMIPASHHFFQQHETGECRCKRSASLDWNAGPGHGGARVKG